MKQAQAGHVSASSSASCFVSLSLGACVSCEERRCDLRHGSDLHLHAGAGAAEALPRGGAHHEQTVPAGQSRPHLALPPEPHVITPRPRNTHRHTNHHLTRPRAAQSIAHLIIIVIIIVIAAAATAAWRYEDGTPQDHQGQHLCLPHSTPSSLIRQNGVFVQHVCPDCRR